LLRSERGLVDALKTSLVWGLGHAATFFGVGLLVAAGLHLPPWLAPLAEVTVAASLVWLGGEPSSALEPIGIAPLGGEATELAFSPDGSTLTAATSVQLIAWEVARLSTPRLRRRRDRRRASAHQPPKEWHLGKPADQQHQHPSPLDRAHLDEVASHHQRRARERHEERPRSTRAP
jgi:hypothetical protein